MSLRARLEAHARLNREERAAGKPRTPLPEDLRDLRETCLCDAYLTGANLSGAVFRGACFVNADLSDANLRGADFTGANLTGAVVDRATFRKQHPDVPVVDNLDAKILAAIEAPGCALDMGTWHTCATTHCRAGWAITLAGEEGKRLEAKTDPATAGTLIYLASTGRVPDFYCDDETALADLRRCAAEPAGGAS